MKTLHLRRQGFLNHFRLFFDKLVIEIYMNDSMDKGQMVIDKIYEIEKVWNGKKYTETHHKNVLSKELNHFNYDEIEETINSVSEEKIKLDHFIESYTIAKSQYDKKLLINDHDFINEVDVTNMLVSEVIEKTKIDLSTYFEKWNRKVGSLINDNYKRILNMSFSELYSLIHWNSHKQNFEDIFVESLYKEA